MVGPLVVAAAAAMVGDCTLVRSMYGPGEERFSREVHAWIGNATAATRGRRHVWGRAPAHEGLVFLEAFVTLSELPPVPEYVNQIGDKPNILGVFTGTEIKLRSDLSEDTERWVAIHEILHWARFAYRGDAGPSAATTAIYDDELRDRSAPLEFNGSHWRTAAMTGTHIASGRPASEELMTSHIGSYAFLSAATLNEVFTASGRRRRSVVDHHWCTDSAPCADGSECVAVSVYFPRRCASSGPTGSGGHRVPPTNPNGNSLPPETVTWIVVGSVAGAVIIGAVAYNLWDRTRRGGVDVSDMLDTARLL
jgi:hypothetical protein